MKRICYVFCFAVIFIFTCLPVSAVEGMSCQDLTEIANAVDDIGIAFSQLDNIQEGGEFDQALGDLVEALLIIASLENETSLTRSVTSMKNAYNNMNADKFTTSLDRVSLNLDKLYNRDCK